MYWLNHHVGIGPGTGTAPGVSAVQWGERRSVTVRLPVVSGTVASRRLTPVLGFWGGDCAAEATEKTACAGERIRAVIVLPPRVRVI